MRISNKITLAIVAASLTCVLTIAAILAFRTIGLSSQALDKKVKSQLTAVKASKKSEISNYFKFIGDQINTLSDSTMTEDALAQLTQAFENIAADSGISPDQESQLASYYRNQFGATYQEINDTSTDVMGKYNQLPDVAKRLQHAYISDNPHPLGSKDAMAKANDGSVYSEIHSVFHPNFQYYLKTFGYYDIFLVDNQGNIVYSVYKELDYATNLLAY
ncbi:hypothetical protein [Salinivibrio kushneri]|uniref:hypothetical protein n=1 Tax=Salinivibrio kushneri TaxID=1908198 RepID=UPI0022B32819|nr:hypothetical protein [Salinivibrio kushneri]WBA10643.1 hypothetical protein O4546_07230 [Salinivibrio kushneri]